MVASPDVLWANCSDVPVIISKKDLFDYSHGEPDPSFETILRILDISDEQVKRQLIVQNHIESTIIIADRKEADQVMHQQPPKVTACYALKPGHEGAGYRLTRHESASHF